ncbi:MAG: TetR/AcrR family transcriptional regulator [Pseudomonadota bacterium]
MKTVIAPEADIGGERGPTVAGEQRIRLIVNEAAKLFDQVGYHNANMEMVAKASNLRKPTLYHYIKSKEEILLRIHQTLIDDLDGKHLARVAGGQVREALLLGIVTDIMRAIADHRGYVRAFVEHYRELAPEIRKQISGKRQQYFRYMTDLIEEGVAEGTYHTDDVNLSALFLLGQVNWAYQWYVPGVSPAPEVIAQKMLDTFLYGLTQIAPPAAMPVAAAAEPKRKAPAKASVKAPAKAAKAPVLVKK